MFKNVLLTIDLTHPEEHKAAIIAAEKHVAEGSHLFVTTVIPLIESSSFVHSFLPTNYDKEMIEKTQTALHEFTKSHLSNTENVKHIVAHGKVYEKVNEIAKKLDIDLIITMASIKKDKASSGFGPNVARIVRNSDCSVLVLRN